MKYLKRFENILVPHNLEGRYEQLKKEIERELSESVYDYDLDIDDPIYLEVDSKVNIITGDVRIRIGKIPLWLKSVKVFGNFWCYEQDLTSLEGGPKIVKGNFYCHYNILTDLKGSPEMVGGNFSCNNKLTTLEGGPKIVKGNFYCYGNDRKFTESEVREKIDVKGSVYV